MKLWKFSGTLFSITGIIHIIVGFLMGKDAYLGMLRDGLFDSVKDDYVRGFALWFLLFGVLMIMMGQTMQHYIKKEQKPAPLFLGYSFLFLGILGCIVEPVSGFWLILPQALIIILAKRTQAE